MIEKVNYDCFVELKEKDLRKKTIMHQLKLTYQKYLYFKEFMKDKQIRKRFKIPKSEFIKFIQSHN